MFEVEPMTRGDYDAYRGWSVPADENPLDEGYLTKDPDGHVSWLPKNTFEKAYMKLEDNPELPSGVNIAQKFPDFIFDSFHTDFVPDFFRIVFFIDASG